MELLNRTHFNLLNFDRSHCNIISLLEIHTPGGESAQICNTMTYNYINNQNLQWLLKILQKVTSNSSLHHLQREKDANEEFLHTICP